MEYICKKLSLLFTVGLLLIVSCSKEDASEDVVNQNGGEISRYQVVTVNVPDIKLSENEYQGTVGGVSVTLTKAEGNKLLFFLPSTTALGTLDLIIPSLNNTTFHYDVKDTVLKSSSEETLIPLFANLDSYTQKLGTSSTYDLTMQNNLMEFKKYYNSASIEDKKQIALAYQVNKIEIDRIILNDYSDVAKITSKTKITNADKRILAKFALSVLSIDIGCMLATSGGHPAVRTLGVIVAGVAVTKSIDFYFQFIENEVKEIGVSVGDILGVNAINKISAGSTLVFQNNVASVLPVKNSKRKLNTTDTGGTQSLLVSFFNSKNSYNYIANKVNSAIQYVNENNSFIKLKTLQLATLPSTTSSVQTVMTKETFDKFRFTITDSNLTLVSAALESDGQLNVKIKITGTPASLPVESFLNYSYSDEFSSFSGKIPVKVVVPKCTPDMLAGNWEFKLYNYDSSNQNGYVYAGSYSITINTIPSYCASSDPSTIVGGQMISNDVANATPTCWYLNNCSVINFTNIGYFDFVPGVSVYTVYANSTHKVDGYQSHVTMTKL